MSSDQKNPVESGELPAIGYSPEDGGGLQRTEFECHACRRMRVAELDYDLDGNHEVHCPCGHIHYRVIQGGMITSERYNSDWRTTKVDGRSVWSSGVVRRQDSGNIEGSRVSTVSQFIRDRWLNRSDIQ